MTNKPTKAELTAEANNYIIIKFGYDSELIFPHKKGMQVLDALNVAEQISDRYKEENTIKPINRDTFTVRMLSQDDYLAYKMNALLEVNDDKN